MIKKLYESSKRLFLYIKFGFVEAEGSELLEFQTYVVYFAAFIISLMGVYAVYYTIIV